MTGIAGRRAIDVRGALATGNAAVMAGDAVA